MSNFSSFSSSFSDGCAPLAAPNCILCKVKLNQIGISHTRSLKCNKCNKIICINCVSPLQKFKALQQKICKNCGHKALLFSPEDSEMENMAQERLELRKDLKKLKTEKIALHMANREIYNELELKKSQHEESKFERELENSKEMNKKLKEKVENKESELDKLRVKVKNLQKEADEHGLMLKDLGNWIWFYELPEVFNGEIELEKDCDGVLQKKIECLNDRLKLNQKLVSNKLVEELNNELKQQIADYRLLVSTLECKKSISRNSMTRAKCSSCILF